MVSQTKKGKAIYDQAVEPLMPGDRVIAMSNIARKRGPRKKPTRRSDKKRFIATVVRVDGHRVIVKNSRGEFFRVMRSMCRYEPTPRVLAQRVARVKQSQFLPGLRRELGLPTIRWPEVDLAYVMDASDEGLFDA